MDDLRILNGCINVVKIKKDLLFKGKKGKYLNITLIPSPNSDYADYILVQDLSKKDAAANKALREIPNFDRSALIRSEIIGNLKISAGSVLSDKDKDDLPF